MQIFSSFVIPNFGEKECKCCVLYEPQANLLDWSPLGLASTSNSGSYGLGDGRV